MEPNQDKRQNPFFIPTIIQHLTAPKINPNEKALKKLRQLSSFHYQILNPKYFDTVQMTININKSENTILYGPCRIPAEQMKPLEPEIWDPITFVPTTIRKLVLDGSELEYLLSSSTISMVAGLNPLELIAQISRYVTTLAVDLEGKHIFQAETNVTSFLQQFVNLKHLKLRNCNQWIPSDMDLLENFLTKIDNEIAREFEIELVLCSRYKDAIFLELLLSTERGFKIKNHKFSLNILYNPFIAVSTETSPWARIFTYTNHNSISVKNFGLILNLDKNAVRNEAERNQIFNDLSIISPYVEELNILEIFEELDNLLFTTPYKWPRLKNLRITSPTVRLDGLSSTCPNLEEIVLAIILSESIFTNTELTDEENLKQIFGNCSNTLKKLKFEQLYESQPDEIRLSIPGSKLLQYLQELLPNTLVEAEESSDSLFSSSESE